MSAEAVARRRVVLRPQSALLGGASAVAACVLALALAVTLAGHPLPLGLVVLGGAALVGTLALALARYDAAVGLGVALLGVVVVDPAPADLVFIVVIAVAAASGRFELNRVPKTVLVAIVVFAALNLVSSLEVIDPARAAAFFSITLYLFVLALVADGLCRVAAKGPPGRACVCLRRGHIGSARVRRAARVVPGRQPPRRGRPCTRLLPGSERLRTVPRARGADPDRRAALAAPAPHRPAHEGDLPSRPHPRRALLLLARCVAEPRDRCRRDARRALAPPRRSAAGAVVPRTSGSVSRRSSAEPWW